jgi:hypothetical protein
MTFLVVMRIKTAGKPRTAARSMSGIASWKEVGGVMIELTIKAPVKQMATGKTTVPTRSIKTTNCIEKQNVPQRFRTRTNSIKLCTVELIHRRRCDRSTEKVSGATVLHLAWGRKIFFRRGNVRSRIVDKNRSSPSKSKFFWCNVETSDCEYSLTISGLTRIGTQSVSASFLALILYIEKQPGRQVTPPKTDSKALTR